MTDLGRQEREAERNAYAITRSAYPEMTVPQLEALNIGHHAGYQAALAAREEPPFESDREREHWISERSTVEKERDELRAALAACGEPCIVTNRPEDGPTAMATREDGSRVEISGDTRKFILRDDGTWHIPRENPPVVGEYSLLVVPASAAREHTDALSLLRLWFDARPLRRAGNTLGKGLDAQTEALLRKHGKLGEDGAWTGRT